MNAQAADDRLTTLLRDLAEREALALVRDRLAAGEDPLAIMNSCQAGMLLVGQLYEQGKYFLSALIMAGEILREIVELLEPALGGQRREGNAGAVLLGTVGGDIHDIGKNMMAILLRCHGFTVRDLGVDVPPGQFLTEAKASRPRIIGLSGLLTVSYDAMRNTVATLRGDAGTAGIPVLIGGGFVNAEVAAYVGADDWATDVMHGVRICQRLCGQDPSR